MTITVKRPEGTVNFCTDLALRGEWEDAVENLEKVRQKEDSERQLTDVADAAHAVQTLEARMRASTLRFRLKGLPRKQWQELGAEHPPREQNAQDASMGVNASTFFDAVAKISIFAVLDAEGAPVDFDAKAEWDALADDMTDGQWREFGDEILRLNRSVTDVPFSRAASLLTRPSEENSTSPTPSESA